ncbi:putative phenylalanine--tRNA ligase [Helianthus annuus]|uniref:Phenylalanine--tRNA ligase n=1 Tax=Helianthus annuus TaxID=4232 RepID=A0A9K3HIV4_HELAN|nr:putative phenylalanine--tRNA ligase [Helianthus annuus]KAJ0863838.1 putative phenylalanine--tRNA ligase [Helianthus annuus]
MESLMHDYRRFISSPGRTQVAIGTHDLYTIDGPLTYEALPPSEIEFNPLKHVKRGGNFQS